jgi:Flp pilus assembly secretin CpaC
MWLVGAAWANEIELGVGRAALVQLDPPPTSVSITRSTVADIQAASPALLIIGRAPGKTTLTLVQAGQPVPYEVVVREDPMFDPTGPGVLPVGPKITVLPGSGGLCRLPFSPSGTTRLETAALQVEQFGGTWFWLQPEKEGAYDVVFERTRGLPLVVTVASVADAKPIIPAGCVGPEYTVTVPLGGETSVPVGKPIDGLLVGHPSRVEATPDGNRLRLRGLAVGRTSVLVRSNNSDEPWLRTVVVAPPAAE